MSETMTATIKQAQGKTEAAIQWKAPGAEANSYVQNMGNLTGSSHPIFVAQFDFPTATREGSQKFNALVTDPQCEITFDQGTHYRWVPLPSSAGISPSISTEKLFAEGWGWNGICVTENGNLAGRGLIASEAVRKIQPNSVIDWYVLPKKDDGLLNFCIAVDNVSQGLIFQLKSENTAPTSILPGVSFEKPGSAIVACQKFDLTSTGSKFSFEDPAPVNPDPTPVGQWAFRKEEWGIQNMPRSYSLKIAHSSGNNYAISAKIGNTLRLPVAMTANGQCEPGQMISTRMMPPPEIYELETRVSKFLQGIQSWHRKGQSLTLTSGQETHEFDWEAPAGFVGLINNPFN